ncbi:MAG: cation-transporting P-type ATPase [Nostoc sp.]|uniref:P-type ATPase n=1 Tax=Nostoc sp. TaxID=1180 RepID=UPI002FFAB216
MTVSTDQETLSHLSLKALQKQLTTSNQGLSKKESLQRQSKGGYNELPETTISPIMQFLSHFWGPIAWMIEAAVILSAIVGDWVNFGIILLLLIGNGVVGFWEEFQAGNAIAGKTAHLVESAQTVSHFQRAVLKIGDYLIVIALVLVVVVFMVALFRGDPWLTTLRFVLVLTVASIPVAMPTVLSVTMAVGAQKLAKKEAIVSRLAAIEEMAIASK